MDDRARARLAIAHEVLQALRSQDFRNAVPEVNLLGQHVIVPALPDDTMGIFFDQMRDAGGTIYVATLEDSKVALLSMSPSRRPRHAPPPGEGDCPVYRHSELGMVISLLRASPGPLRCYEVQPSVMLELLDGAPPVIVPA